MEKIKNRNGFTLVEVIIVFVMMGIVSAFLASSYFNVTASSLTSEVDVVKSHLRYAQARSMNTNTVWGINISSTTQYSLFTNGNTSNMMLLPGQDTNTLTLPSGVAFAGTGIVSFDSWGKPYTDAGAASAQSSTRTFTLSSGSSSQSINITPNTGFIP